MVNETNAQPSINEAMANVMADIGNIGKERTNDYHKFAFRGIDDIYNGLYEPLTKHRIFLTHEVMNVEYEQVGTKSQSAKLTIRYQFNGPGGDSISSTVIGEAIDASDKATAKAYSSALKTCILQMFMVPIHGADDPDNHSPERNNVQTQRPSPQQRNESTLTTQAKRADYPLDQLLNDAKALAAQRNLAQPKTLNDVPPSHYQPLLERINAHKAKKNEQATLV